MVRQYYHGPKQKAWEATRNLYAKRITGGAFIDPHISDVEFPAEEVAEAAALPVSSNVVEHEAMFTALKKSFEARWAERDLNGRVH